MGDFVVSARKYRPGRFDEVVGQEHVSTTLKRALSTGHLAHAFLFHGPRGVGKTTCARILAKVINCQNKTEDFEPCGACDSCVAFQKNASFNIVELDAASNNSVENIRSLVEQVRIPPQSGKYKVFIIDEVHMLSQAAFNAFLKTLEEPPAYAIFILATTEKHKILPTILSRCQIYDFKRIGVTDISRHLASIAVKEQIESESLALHVIAEKADGALRDALSIFDRLASGAIGKLTYQSVISQLNILDYDVYMRVTDALLLEDRVMVLNILDDVIKKGFEPDTFILGLAEHMRNLMVAREPANLHLLEVSDEVKDRYTAQAYTCSPSFLVTALDALNYCDIHFKTAVNKRLHVEIALIKLAHIQSLISSDAPIGSEQKKNNESLRPANHPKEQTLSTEKRLVAESKTEVPNPPASKFSGEQSKHASKTRNQGLIIGPSLKKVEELKETLKAEEQLLASRQCLLNADSLKKLWDTYAQETQSPSLRAVMHQARLSCKDMEVTIFVGSTLAKNMLTQETGIADRIREDLFVKDLQMDVQIDPNMTPAEEETQARPRTDKDKYEFLLQKNPLLSTFIKELHLKPEE